MEKLNLEVTDFEVSKCPCCGEDITKIIGDVFDKDGEILAFYIAQMQRMKNGSPMVKITIDLVDRQEEIPNKIADMILSSDGVKIVIPSKEKIKLHIEPMRKADRFDKPTKQLFCKVVDFIVEEDPYIKPFLLPNKPGTGE